VHELVQVKPCTLFEKFPLYSVLHKDWDLPQSTRLYQATRDCSW